VKYMGAVTAVVAAAGIGLGVAQAVKQNKLKKQADSEASAAANRLRNIKEENPFSGVQVPTVGNKMAMDQIDQTSADTIAALQGTGAEGVLGGVGEVNRAVQGAQLDVAANQNQQQYQRDMAIAQGQSDINARKSERDYYTEMSTLQGAQQAAADAEYNKNQAIAGAFGSLSTGLSGLQNSDAGVYKKNKSGATTNFDLGNMTPDQRELYASLSNNPEYAQMFSNFKSK
jgi:hypothetical protein